MRLSGLKQVFVLSNAAMQHLFRRLYLYRVTILVLVCTLPALCQAAVSPATQHEIAHLFTTLENSGCQFNRNGSWYSAKEASAHLRTKYSYLQDKNGVDSAEQFIERAATQSSLSSKAYQIKCEGLAAAPSGPWFKAVLVKFRQTAK